MVSEGHWTGRPWQASCGQRFFLLAKEAQTQLWLAPGPQNAAGCIMSKALPHKIHRHFPGTIPPAITARLLRDMGGWKAGASAKGRMLTGSASNISIPGHYGWHTDNA